MTNEEKNVAAATRLITLAFSKRGAVAALVLLLAAGGSGGFLANVAHAFLGPAASIEITSPQMQTMIEEELSPVRTLLEEQALKLGVQAVQLYSVEQSVERNEVKVDKVADNLNETMEALNHLVGQVEILVKMEIQRLGVIQH